MSDLMTKDTLAAMREAGLDDEHEEQPLPGEENELEIEAEPNPDEVVLDGEAEEAEVVLGDDTGAPTRAERGLKKTLGHLRRDRRALRDENDTLGGENTALRAELDQLKAATLKKPQYTDYPTDEAFETALLQYHALTVKPPTAAAPAVAAAPAAGPDFSASVNAHYQRAEKLGVNLDKFEAAERSVRQELGDVLTDALIDSVGVGSEKAIMLIGSNPTEFEKVKSLLASDRSGLKAVGHLSRLAERAKLTKRRVSGAPTPTRSPTGGGAVVVGAAEKALAKAEKADDPHKMFRARRELRKAKKAAAASN